MTQTLTRLKNIRTTLRQQYQGYHMQRLYDLTKKVMCPQHGHTCTLTTMRSEDEQEIEQWAVCVVMNLDGSTACDFAFLHSTRKPRWSERSSNRALMRQVIEGESLRRKERLLTEGSVGLGPWMKISRKGWVDLDELEEDRMILGPSY